MLGITRIHRPEGSLSAALMAHREPNVKDGEHAATGPVTPLCTLLASPRRQRVLPGICTERRLRHVPQPAYF